VFLGQTLLPSTAVVCDNTPFPTNNLVAFPTQVMKHYLGTTVSPTKTIFDERSHGRKMVHKNTLAKYLMQIYRNDVG
jgi:hypothetical protein